MKIQTLCLSFFITSITLYGAQPAPVQSPAVVAADKKQTLQAFNVFMHSALPCAKAYALINAYASEIAQLHTIIPAESRLGGRADIKALPHNRFAVHRGARIQTWQLLADTKVEKEANEYDTEPNERGVMCTGTSPFTALPDGTVIFSKSYHGDETFHCQLNHWDPRTNQTVRHGGSNFQTAPRITPLKSGQIVLFYAGSPEIAHSAAGLSESAGLGKPLPYMRALQALSASAAVAAHKDAVTIYDTAQWTARTTESIPANETVEGIEVVDDNRFLTWGEKSVLSEKEARRLNEINFYGLSASYCFPAASNPFIDLWHADGRTQTKLKRLQPTQSIKHATTMGSRCFALGIDGIVRTFDLADGSEQAVAQGKAGCESLAKLTDGTIVAGNSDNSVSVVAQLTPIEEAYEEDDRTKKQEEAMQDFHKKLMADIKAKAPHIIAGTLLKKNR